MTTQKFLEATKNILENNLKINDLRYSHKSVVLVYDLDSKLSTEVSAWYRDYLEERANTECINFNSVEKEILKEKLLWLEEGSTVILVQSSNFRLDDFRIRLNLHNKGIWCLEHNHLKYIKDDQIETYADALEYRFPFYQKIGDRLKNLSDQADSMKIICQDGSILNITGWFEDMKQNIWDYESKIPGVKKNRWSTFPVGEVFTESRIFENVNGELSLYAFPNDDMQVEFCEPFKVRISKSILSCEDVNCPENFRHILDKISASEDGEVMCRELWFWMNSGITKEKPLSDINSFERVTGFHMSLWKKHQMYRKKIHHKINQRYHIDIFPDIKEIFIGNEKVFEYGRYIC